MNDFSMMLQDLQDSEEYLMYKDIGKILEEDPVIMNLMNEIKELQHESLTLEYNNDPKYLELEDIIKYKVNILNSNDNYKLYLKKMEEYNKYISNSKLSFISKRM